MNIEYVDIYGNGSLRVRKYTPVNSDLSRLVVICGGLGINSLFYQPFARWLSQRGCCVVTFDHRGLGLNAVPRSKMRAIDLDTWFSQDLSTIFYWLRLKYPGLPLGCIGHSFGGATLGVAPAIDLVDRIVLVSAQSGYVGNFGVRVKLLLFMYIYVLIPILVPIYGCFPAKKIRAGENIPASIIRRWRKWVRVPGYLQSDLELNREGYRKFKGIISAFVFSDDIMAPMNTVAEVVDYYSQATHSSFQTISPEDAGMSEIGHFKMFSHAAAETIWPRIYKSLSSPPEWLGGIRH
ncbi:hypothetical protein B6S59_28660 [Pseudomonas sp. A46]|nr:alpha/beta fold hydrolase [Pseudomonas sp. A46]OWJ90211.1 hypothetical protein B6S59_28660 [Pseudomonas sp. A46]